MRVEIHNWEIVMFALFSEGGVVKPVHTEDITLKCFGLAPDAFSWLRHRNYPDKEVVRKDLIRLRDGQFGGIFVEGRAGVTKRETDGLATPDGWRLTAEGVKWIRENQSRLEAALETRNSKATRQEALRALSRIRKHPLFSSYKEDPNAFVPSLGELADMLRCRVDAEDRVWDSRFKSAKNLAELTEEGEVLAFLQRCEALRPSVT